MYVPQKSGMSYSLCVCRHQIVFLIQEIDVARYNRAQYILYELEGVVRTMMFDNKFNLYSLVELRDRNMISMNFLTEATRHDDGTSLSKSRVSFHCVCAAQWSIHLDSHRAQSH